MESTTIAPVLGPAELEELLHQRAELRLLDVRTPGEFETMHIRGAYNVPLGTLGEHAAELRATVNEPVVLICQSGSRARQAEEALRGAGMPNLHVLDGGVSAWVSAGKPVQRGAVRLSLERQVRITAGAIASVGGVLALLVDPLFALVPAAVGGGLVFAGVTDTCAMAMLLARLPYNRPASCDVAAMVRALGSGESPPQTSRPSGAAKTPPSCAA